MKHSAARLRNVHGMAVIPKTLGRRAARYFPAVDRKGEFIGSGWAVFLLRGEISIARRIEAGFIKPEGPPKKFIFEGQVIPTHENLGFGQAFRGANPEGKNEQDHASLEENLFSNCHGDHPSIGVHSAYV
jgi:hypothetical protein